jgi:glutamate-ammonia-ligase adenylyltransferase
MGKLGAAELNYASDIDLMLVGDGNPRPVLEVARAGWRVDLDLRPEGRSGPLIRSLESYLAYWDRWAQTWEFQALLKARVVAGDADLGARWAEEAAGRVWSRPFGADELRQVRDMKGRAEAEVARRGLTNREVKAGRGGIRDIEFAVQLLQMVHGRADPALRAPGTVTALGALAAGGYVDPADAGVLVRSYQWLRTVEHRLQLTEGQPAHAVPQGPGARTRLARSLGYRDRAQQTAAAQFDAALRAHQANVRAIHERLFFRPLLEAFTSHRPAAARNGVATPRAATLEPAAIEDRLAAFGFSDAARTRSAVRELTAGFSRASRLWQQLLPLVLGWLSESPDPDLGLLGLRALADSPHARDQVISVVRESAEAARQLCLFLGTGAGFTRDLLRNPDLLRRPDVLRGHASDGGAWPVVGTVAAADLAARATRSVAWRDGRRQQQEGLQAFRRSEELTIAARDVLGGADVERTGHDLSDLAEATLAAAIEIVAPRAPLALIAMGRLGGRELSYASDLDVLLVQEGDPGPPSQPGSSAAEAQALLQLLNGETPAMRVYTLDTSLRPEGRQGPVVRSLESYATYYRRWAQTWERQALLRGRVVAGDADLGDRFAELARSFVWDRPVTDDDVRTIRRTKARIERERIPAGEDPQFHLKLGRGSLSDIEWTTQLLQLRHRVVAAGTLDGLDGLVAAGVLDPDDAATLAGAFRFCQHTRNRLTLVRGAPADALPGAGAHLTALARSLGTSATELREEYRRVTRRSRRVVERLFYGEPAHP